MYDFIFLLGAPGVGKTTIARLLKEKLKFPNEIKIDNTNQSPEQSVDKILEII